MNSRRHFDGEREIAGTVPNPRDNQEAAREIQLGELTAAILEGIDSVDAGSIEEVVQKNRIRRGADKRSSQ